MREIWSDLFFIFMNWCCTWRPWSPTHSGHPNAGPFIGSPFNSDQQWRGRLASPQQQIPKWTLAILRISATKSRHYFPCRGNWYWKESFADDRGKLVNSSESSGCGTSMKIRNFALVGSSVSVVNLLAQPTNALNVTDWRLYDMRVFRSIYRLIATLHYARGS